MTTRRLAAVAAVTALFVPASAPATPATPAPATATAAWTGVSEVVVVDVAASGLVSGSPSQATVVTAVGPSTVPVGVPMSSAGLRRIGPGSPPPVIDDVAQFSFDGSGTQTQTVSSTFAQPLPVTVTPTYELDGESTTPDELARTLSDRERRSGTLTVTYEIANVTSQTTTVSFVDPAGARRTEVVTQAVPIAGALSLTFPRNASGIDAPGATLTPGASGVGASWTVMLAPPLAPTRQSISYSVNLTNAQVPPRQAVPWGRRARQAPDRRGASRGWRSSGDGPVGGAGSGRAGPGRGPGVTRTGASVARGARAGPAERAGAGEPRLRRALERPRAAVRRRPLGPLADDLDDRDESRVESSRPRSPRSAMRWTASEPRSPTTPIG